MLAILRFLLWIGVLAVSIGVTVGLLYIFLTVLPDLVITFFGAAGIWLAAMLSIFAGGFFYIKIQARLRNYLPNF